MFSIFIALLTGLLVGLVSSFGFEVHWVWSLVLGLLAAILAQLGLSWLMRKRIQREMNAVQSILLDGQKRLQHKVNQWQTRPPGSVKQAQNEMERDQARFLEQALTATRRLERFYRWSPMLKRQTSTLRMQLHYQRKDYAAVDRLMPECLFMDPITMSMKLARMYRRDEPTEAIDAAFRKFKRRLRYGQGAIVYALLAWILVQRKAPDQAHKLLLEAGTRMKNDVIDRNRDQLANNRVRQFSNAGLGDEWYALGLEQPKIQTQRQRGARFARR